MKRINREEYEELKELDDKWKWIARDSNMSLWAYNIKPRRYGGSFGLEDPVEGDCHYIHGDQFSFVRWEDEKPYSIAELVEEYENSAEHVSHVVNEKVKALGKAWDESEETEVKKQELIKTIKYLAREASQNYPHEEMVELPDVLNAINQLDEPELPVIPKFVAEWIEKYIKYGYDLYSALKKMENHARVWMKTYKWYEKNTLKFVNAYLTREYKLEKEPLYRARLKIITNEFTDSYLNTESSDSGERLKAFEIGSKYIHEDFRHLSEFTEDELRVIGIWGSELWEIEEVEE